MLLLLPVGMLVVGYYDLLKEDSYFSGKGLLWLVMMNMFLHSTMNWLFILLSGYLVHYFLRTINRTNKAVAIAHVIITMILVVFAGNDHVATSIVPGWHTTIWAPASFGFLTGMAPWPGILFWIVQLLFIAYGIFIIRRWRNSPA